MGSTKSWFQKFQPRERFSSSSTKKDSVANEQEDPEPLSEEEVSNLTKQRAAAAKQYIENHYKEHMKNLHERRERRNLLEKKLADADVTEEYQTNLLTSIEKKETEYMRLQRLKMGCEDYMLLAMIGKGAFGEVEHVKTERNLLAEVDSNYIVKLFCSFQDDEYLYLIMEYLPGGDMMTLLMRKDTLTEDEARFYVAEIILAIESIHKHNFIHRDNKPDNILLDKYGHLRLSNFGLCKSLDCITIQEDFTVGDNDNGTSKSDGSADPKRTQREQLQHWQKNRRMLAYSTVGTPNYIAPEVLQKKGGPLVLSCSKCLWGIHPSILMILCQPVGR